jgi:hypothetical protein
MSASWDMVDGKKLEKDYVYPGGSLWDGVNYVQIS